MEKNREELQLFTKKGNKKIPNLDPKFFLSMKKNLFHWVKIISSSGLFMSKLVILLNSDLCGSFHLFLTDFFSLSPSR